MDRIVIVGAGQGGFQAAASLRQEGFAGEIALIGDEPGLPYQRPPLSKAYLKSGNAEALNLRPESFYAKNAITRVRARIDRIDRMAAAVFAGAEAYPYDHLILATGTRNARPNIPGIEHALDLRTLADAERIRGALGRPRRCAVIGGGFIGLEFAAVARALGHDVAVAEAAPRLMARVLSLQMSEQFREMHEAMETQLHLGNPVQAVSGDGIILQDETKIAADMVLLAAGVVPNTELASDAGLPVDNGVVVDQVLLTEDAQISALGDCCAFPDPSSGRMIRLESVQAATDHARLIARRLVKNVDAAYQSVPWFWSDQADWKLQIAGLAFPDDESVSGSDGAVFRFRGERLSAVETINDAKTHMKARRFLAGDALTRDDVRSAFVNAQDRSWIGGA